MESLIEKLDTTSKMTIVPLKTGFEKKNKMTMLSLTLVNSG